MQEIFIVLLCGLLYAGLGTFIAGIAFPDDEEAWIIGLFWPIMLLVGFPIWVINTAQMTGQAIGKFLKQFNRKGDHHERLR